jgi:hypothetical protein
MVQQLSVTCSRGDTLGPLGYPVTGAYQQYKSINQKCAGGYAGMSAIDDGQGIRSPAWLRWFCPSLSPGQQVSERW